MYAARSRLGWLRWLHGWLLATTSAGVTTGVTTRPSNSLHNTITSAFARHRTPDPPNQQARSNIFSTPKKNRREKSASGGPGTGMLFLLPLPLPVGQALELAATTGERMVSCSPVSFNDIKHLARSMPADGLEAQDVVPPRCGCWGCPHGHFRRGDRFLGKAHTPGPPRPAIPSISRRRRPPAAALHD